MDDAQRLVFDTLVKDYPAHYSAIATAFRRHAIGFAATVRNGNGVLWIGPSGIELSETPVADGRQVLWDDVVDVETRSDGGSSSRPSAGSVFLLGAWSLLVDPEDTPVEVVVTLRNGGVIGATVLGSSNEEVRALVSGFRAAHAVAPVAADGSGVGKLERLSALHDARKITDEEFAAAKRELLRL